MNSKLSKLIGPGTKVTFSLQTVFSIIITTAMGAGLYYNMATEDYVDAKIKEAIKDKIVEVKEVADKNEERIHKIDTAIELLSESNKNHERNLEVFTTALEKLREDMTRFMAYQNRHREARKRKH